MSVVVIDLFSTLEVKKSNSNNTATYSFKSPFSGQMVLKSLLPLLQPTMAEHLP